ncbi:hypothetical protein DYBT9275_01952 [Dyadobacter sp. CECT 9275]|uniref:Alpha/beta hydrolase fold-5 domain-containing protein n=1 Tax=Dyadobacter helix TaxID=2822344 RepID=A0A916N5G6_9BACT|nr:alpha/beta hydrolase [Dyadobacter sp. CECT 9275]CAG4998200.1 hypothetical protein DYBT9275_01952 [Dyadobacter sp. CECT 9275]
MKKHILIRYLRFAWVSAGLLFICWLVYSMQVHDVDSKLLNSDSGIKVEQSKNLLSFSPKTSFKKVFIFYPGALVDPYAYVPLCRKIAETGIQSIIVKMPLRLANRGYLLPKELGLLADPEKEYILSGHSQGAKMAARFVYENPGMVDKLVLMGTTHPKETDMSAIAIPVMKIYGLNDGVASPEDVVTNKTLLPATTRYVPIPGANHSQFGYYGFQLGDHAAMISRDKQQQIILQNILDFIQ